jgi:hypothetical protein
VRRNASQAGRLLFDLVSGDPAAEPQAGQIRNSGRRLDA